MESRSGLSAEVQGRRAQRTKGVDTVRFYLLSSCPTVVGTVFFHSFPLSSQPTVFGTVFFILSHCRRRSTATADVPERSIPLLPYAPPHSAANARRDPRHRRWNRSPDKRHETPPSAARVRIRVRRVSDDSTSRGMPRRPATVPPTLASPSAQGRAHGVLRATVGSSIRGDRPEREHLPNAHQTNVHQSLVGHRGAVPVPVGGRHRSHRRVPDPHALAARRPRPGRVLLGPVPRRTRRRRLADDRRLLRRHARHLRGGHVRVYDQLQVSVTSVTIRPVRIARKTVHVRWPARRRFLFHFCSLYYTGEGGRNRSRVTYLTYLLDKYKTILEVGGKSPPLRVLTTTTMRYSLTNYVSVITKLVIPARAGATQSRQLPPPRKSGKK